MTAIGHRLLLSGPALPGLDPVSLVDVAGRAGFDAVAIKLFGTPAMPLAQDVTAPAFIRAMRAALAAAGVEAFSGTLLYLRPEMDWDTIAAGLDAGAAIGIGTVLVIGDDPDPGRMAQNLARLCDLAVPRGIVCALENAPYRALPTVASVRRLIAAADRPGAALCLNVVNHAVMGEGLDALGPVSHIQLADAVITAEVRVSAATRATRVAYGKGSIALPDVIAALSAATMVSPELTYPDATTDRDAAVAWTRRLGAATHALLRGTNPAGSLS